MSSACCPARARPDETVIYTAHWDHLGIGLPDANGDRIYNGAIDNGTGIAQLIEQARAFAAGPRPQRSVVFMAVTAEEKGLLGSEYYAANPLYPAAKTAGVINTDVMGVLGPARDFSVRGNQKFGLLDMLVEEGAKRGRRYTPDPRAGDRRLLPLRPFHPRQGRHPGAELHAGARTWSTAASRGPRPGRRITRPTCITSRPTNIRPTGTSPAWRQDAELLHAVGLRLANSCDWPNWSADSEFRAARDRSAAERQRRPSARASRRERRVSGAEPTLRRHGVKCSLLCSSLC